MARSPYFTRATFRFLAELACDNDRGWFDENRARYEEDVRVPALRLIQDFAPHLAEISPHFSAGPRCLFRIHRDVRFSGDKSPYKTHTGIQFRHERGRDAHAPGFYVHVEPGGVFLALGMWRPGSAALRAVRERIVEDPAGWRRASRARGFREVFELQGEALSRAPRGFDADDPLIEDLKRKDFIGVREVPESFVTSADLPAALARSFRAGAPFARFLCRALEVPF